MTRRSDTEASARREGPSRGGDGITDGRIEERFYMERLPEGEGPFELTGPEAAHLAGARRLAVGDVVTLFDGSGWDVIAEVAEAGRRSVTLVAKERRHVGPPTAVKVVCATALPKGSREDDLVAQCAQIGVTRIVPVEFARSVARGAANWEKRSARMHRLAVEAAKQCGASTIMETAEPVALADFLAAALDAPDQDSSAGGTAEGSAASGRRTVRLLGMPRAERGAIEVLDLAWPFGEVVYLVGPEGGITDEEAGRVVAAGFEPVRLSATTLRIETAAAAFAAVIAAFVAGKM